MVARVQDAGLAKITALLIASAFWLQWGTGSAAAKTANVVTTTSTTEARASASLSQTTVSSVTNNTFQLTGTLTAAGTRAITEVGAFDAAGSGSPPTGGNMDIYGDFSAINLANGDSIAFTIAVTFS